MNVNLSCFHCHYFILFYFSITLLSGVRLNLYGSHFDFPCGNTSQNVHKTDIFICFSLFLFCLPIFSFCHSFVNYFFLLSFLPLSFSLFSVVFSFSFQLISSVHLPSLSFSSFFFFFFFLFSDATLSPFLIHIFSFSILSFFLLFSSSLFSFFFLFFIMRFILSTSLHYLQVLSHFFSLFLSLLSFLFSYSSSLPTYLTIYPPKYHKKSNSVSLNFPWLIYSVQRIQ